MNNLEFIISQNDDTLYNSVVKYFNYFKPRLNNESINYIFVQQAFYPDALIFTNKRLLVCIQKNLGGIIEIQLEIPLIEILKYSVNEGILTDDIIFLIGNTNVHHTLSNYPKKTAIYIGNQLERITKINQPIWDRLLKENDY
jgi:hypothetical protein